MMVSGFVVVWGCAHAGDRPRVMAVVRASKSLYGQGVRGSSWEVMLGVAGVIDNMSDSEGLKGKF
jgi:hypothetical protein